MREAYAGEEFPPFAGEVYPVSAGLRSPPALQQMQLRYAHLSGLLVVPRRQLEHSPVDVSISCLRQLYQLLDGSRLFSNVQQHLNR